jgi:hypothetical protein
MQHEPLEWELSAMTLQVGLVGSDGIVIASDRLLQQFENGGRSVSLVSKFLNAPGVLCCWAGDIIAEYAANNVWRLDWASVPNESGAIRRELISAGERAWADGERMAGTLPNYSRKVIVACHDSLWLLEIGINTIANQRFDRVVSGDAQNTSRYFINKYAEGCQRIPVVRLIMLAAYTVLAAGQDNPHGVGGIQVAVIPKGRNAIFLGHEQEEELRQRADKIDDALQKQIAESFDYELGI